MTSRVSGRDKEADAQSSAYLVQSWFEDLEGHAERQSASFAAVTQVTERGVTDHGRQRCVFPLTST